MSDNVVQTSMKEAVDSAKQHFQAAFMDYNGRVDVIATADPCQWRFVVQTPDPLTKEQWSKVSNNLKPASLHHTQWSQSIEYGMYTTLIQWSPQKYIAKKHIRPGFCRVMWNMFLVLVFTVLLMTIGVAFYLNHQQAMRLEKNDIFQFLEHLRQGNLPLYNNK